ncbi:MAG: hypothetical protein FWG73_05935 [Planctomycetaceae bacterium]|nr:hypothetical protein [Planctomycetaceae bacterium]
MDFEHQLTQMVPVIREKEPKQPGRVHSVAKIALGFVLGAFATYCFMQPSDTEPRPERQATYKLVFDEANLQQLRRPMDVRHAIVRVPVPPKEEPVQWSYGVMRSGLQQF